MFGMVIAARFLFSVCLCDMVTIMQHRYVCLLRSGPNALEMAVAAESGPIAAWRLMNVLSAVCGCLLAAVSFHMSVMAVVSFVWLSLDANACSGLLMTEAATWHMATVFAPLEAIIDRLSYLLASMTCFLDGYGFEKRTTYAICVIADENDAVISVIIDVAVHPGHWLEMSDGFYTTETLIDGIGPRDNVVGFEDESPMERAYGKKPIRNVYGAHNGMELERSFTKTSHCIRSKYEAKAIGRWPALATATKEAMLNPAALVGPAVEMNTQNDSNYAAGQKEMWPWWVLGHSRNAARDLLSWTIVCVIRMGADVEPMPCYANEGKKKRVRAALEDTLLGLIPRWADPAHGCISCGVKDYAMNANLSANPGHYIKKRHGIKAASAIATSVVYSMCSMRACTPNRSSIPGFKLQSAMQKPEVIKVTDISARVVTAEEHSEAMLLEHPDYHAFFAAQYDFLTRMGAKVTKTRIIEALPADKIAEEKMDVAPTNHAIARRRGQTPSLVGLDINIGFVGDLIDCLSDKPAGLGCDAKEFDMHVTQVALLERAFMTLKMAHGNYALHRRNVSALHSVTHALAVTGNISCLHLDQAMRRPCGCVREIALNFFGGRYGETIQYLHEFYCEMPRAVTMYGDGLVQLMPGKFRSGSTKTSDDNTSHQIMNFCYICRAPKTS